MGGSSMRMSSLHFAVVPVLGSREVSFGKRPTSSSQSKKLSSYIIAKRFLLHSRDGFSPTVFFVP